MECIRFVGHAGRNSLRFNRRLIDMAGCQGSLLYAGNTGPAPLRCLNPTAAQTRGHGSLCPIWSSEIDTQGLVSKTLTVPYMLCNTQLWADAFEFLPTFESEAFLSPPRYPVSHSEKEKDIINKPRFAVLLHRLLRRLLRVDRPPAPQRVLFFPSPPIRRRWWMYVRWGLQLFTRLSLLPAAIHPVHNEIFFAVVSSKKFYSYMWAELVPKT
jgi:hypothetical protein